MPSSLDEMERAATLEWEVESAVEALARLSLEPSTQELVEEYPLADAFLMQPGPPTQEVGAGDEVSRQRG